MAWETLVRRFQSRIYALAVYYVRDPEEARDLAQEVFVRIYRNLDKCKNTDTFVAWMLAMGRNCCIDRLRRMKARPQTAWSEDQPDVVDQSPTPEEACRTKDHKALVYKALEKLSLQSREVILLKEIQGLKIREIASMLALPQGTVKSRFGRARVELAQAVLELEPGFAGRGGNP